MEANDPAIGSFMGCGSRTTDALPDRHYIAPVRPETDFRSIVRDLFYIKPGKGRRSVEGLRVNGVVIDEKHMRQFACGQRGFALGHDLGYQFRSERVIVK